MMSNTNPETGVRYGVIACQRLNCDVEHELFYGAGAKDLSYQAAYDEAKAEAELGFDHMMEEAEIAANEVDYLMQAPDRDEFIEAKLFAMCGCDYKDEYVEEQLHEFSDRCQIEEPIIEGTYEGVKYRITWLGGAPLLMVFEGPLGFAQRLCSPCVPNAADLDGGFILVGEVAPPFYRWVDGDCPDKTDSLEEARQWEREDLEAGREAYITDGNNRVVDETMVQVTDQDHEFPCYCIPRDWMRY